MPPEGTAAEAATARESAQTSDDFAAFEKSRNAGKAPADDDIAEAASADTAGAAKSAVEETDSPEDTQEPGSPGQGIDKRFKKLTTEIRELRSQLAAKAEPVKVAPDVASPEPAGTNAKPVAEKFNTYEDYVEALTDWKLAERDRVSAAAAETAKAADGAKAKFETFQGRAAEFRKATPDYDEVTGQEIPLSRAMHEIVLDSERGPELAYYLGTNPEECERISKLSPLAAAKALGVIEHGFAKPETPETTKPKVSAAPKPPAPVGGRASTPKSIDDPDLDYREFEKRRNRQLRDS
jgi:hypothetical protein